MNNNIASVQEHTIERDSVLYDVENVTNIPAGDRPVYFQKLKLTLQLKPIPMSLS